MILALVMFLNNLQFQLEKLNA